MVISIGNCRFDVLALLCYLLTVVPDPSAALIDSDGPETTHGMLSSHHVRQLLSDKEMSKIKSDYLIKDSADLKMQYVSPEKMIVFANGIKYDLSQLEPVTLPKRFSATVDGSIVMPVSPTYEGDVNGAHVIMFKDEDGRPEFIHFDDGVKQTSLQSLKSGGSKNILFSMTHEDWDEEQLKKYELHDYSEVEIPTTTSEVASSEKTTPQKQEWARRLLHRQMQAAACPSFRVIEVAIAFEHTLCATYGWRNAMSRIQAIVSMASRICESLCIKLELIHVAGICDASKDIYETQIENNQESGCSSDGLLQGFTRIWENFPRFEPIHRDVAHLFTGNTLEGNTIGCAWFSQLCTESSYGVDSIVFSEAVEQQALLFTHELGHNMGALHSGSGFVMSPIVNTATENWSDGAGTNITNYVSSRPCVSVVDNDGNEVTTSTSAPTTTQPPTEGPFYRIVAATDTNICWTYPEESGQQMQVSRCTSRKAQRQMFTIDLNQATIHPISDSQLCVTTSTNSAAANEQVMLTDCATSGLRKHWNAAGDGFIRPALNSNTCVARYRGNLLLRNVAGGNVVFKNWIIFRLS